MPVIWRNPSDGFGEHIQAKVRLLNCNLGESSSTIEADICGHTLSIGLPLPENIRLLIPSVFWLLSTLLAPTLSWLQLHFMTSKLRGRGEREKFLERRFRDYR